MNPEPIELNHEVEALLVSANLPTSDLYFSNQTQLFGVRADACIIGIVGVEIYEDVGLLRSLVVDNGFRKSGHGQKLVSKAETWASERNIKFLYLLTTTSASFFSRLGYEEISRTRAPASIKSTAQFSGLCPSSATFMCKTLSANKSPQPTPNSSAAKL